MCIVIYIRMNLTQNYFLFYKCSESVKDQPYHINCTVKNKYNLILLNHPKSSRKYTR